MRRRSKSPSQRDKNSDPLDDLQIETPRSVVEPIPPVVHRPPVRIPQGIEDRRRWAPAETRDSPARESPRDVSGRIARISHQPKTSPKVRRGLGGKPLQAKRSVMTRLANASPRFAEARKAIICFKRKVRREVLFALKQTRSGAGSPKRRNEYSDVEC